MELKGFIGPAYRSTTLNADAELLMNLYMEPVESGLGSTAAILLRTPGTVLAELLPTGPLRGTFAQDGRMWAAGGNTVYEIFYSASGVWTATSRGTLLVDGNPVTFGSSGDQGHQLAICSGGAINILDLLTHTYTASVVTSANQVVFYNGYFVRLDTTTSTIGISDLYAGLTWDPTQVAQRSLASDRLVGMIVSHNQLWLFGSQTSEPWYDSGASPFPIVPFNAIVVEQGAASGFAIENFDNSIAWVGSSERGANIVWRANGYNAARISNSAVEFSMQSQNVTDWVTFAYQDQGHSFLVVTSPAANLTWVYDAALPPATGWHQRGFFNAPLEQYDAYRPMFHAYFKGMHVVGDRAGRGLYQLSMTTYTDVASQPLRWARRAPHVTTEQQWLFHEQFHLDGETGVGLANGQGSDPQVALRWSDDGGHTWSNSYAASFGAIGNYNARAIWRRLGRSRDRVYEVSGTDPVPMRLTNAYLRLSGGTGQS